MKKSISLFIAIGSLFASSLSSFGIVGLGIERQCANIVLSWPSTGNEHYLIQFRPTLDPSTPWTNLTNNYPANSTNRTTYTVYNVVPPCPPGAASRTMMLSGSTIGNLTKEQRAEILQVREEVRLVTLLAKCKAEGREPFDWEINNVPPLPPSIDEVRSKILKARLNRPEKLVLETSVESPVLESGTSQMKSFVGTADLNGAQPQGANQLDGGGGAALGNGFFRVFHIPDFPNGVTNFTFDGPIFIPVNFKDYVEHVADVVVLLDGHPISDSVFTSLFYNNQTNWGMGVYFDLFPSGTHQLQLRTTLRLNEEVGDATDFLVLSNISRSITVDNQVMYTNWDGLIMTTNFTYKAQTKNQNTDWSIDIYDAWNNYVNGGSGHTSNGQIEWLWDLADTSGNPRDDLDSDPFFYTYITFTPVSANNGPQAAPATRRAPSPQTEYPNTGYWIVSYADRHILDAGPYYAPGQQDYLNSISGIVSGPALRNIPSSTFPIKFGTNYTQIERNNSWIDLRATLYDSHYRNFYYTGHGNGSSIGCDAHTYDTNGVVAGGTSYFASKANLTSQSVSNEITFNRYSGSRPYRFVWLDGCSTSTGNWPGAWGVDKAPHDHGYYTNSISNPSHRRPNAFVGWNQTVGGPGWGTTLTASNFRSEWMVKWSYNWQTEGLWQAFQDARQSANWPPGGDGQLWGALQVYGYTNLLFNYYNQKNDWRWP